MYPSSSSSSSQGSLGPNTTGNSGGGLTRYGSAPSSVFKTAVDSVVGNLQTPFGFRPSEASNSESSSKSNLNDHSYSRGGNKTETAIGLHRSYDPSSSSGAAASSSSLVRHSSSPAGFLNHLATAAGDNGFSMTRGMGSSYNSKGIADNSLGISRLNSQLSFTHPKESLSRISEEAENIVADSNGQTKSTHSYAAFGMTSWDDSTNTHAFSIGPAKRAKTVATHIVNDLDAMESQFQFGMPQSSLEMSAMDKLLHIPQDSVPCKIRAKRGCATHPRSIAERERRTRISGKLKKLQDLVPNMDKQTSYADMLDLAVQHIKVLQNQVQKLKKEVNDCTCGCNKNSDS